MLRYLLQSPTPIGTPDVATATIHNLILPSVEGINLYSLLFAFIILTTLLGLWKYIKRTIL
jgi:hypothetical protein